MEKIVKNINYKKKNVSLLRKYSNEINWCVEQQRYKNGRIVKILPGDIINEIFSIDNDLKMAYQLKELFLDIVYHAEIDDVERQLNDFINICNESGIEEFIDAASTIENWLP